MTHTLLIIAGYELIKWAMRKLWDNFINND